MQVKPAEPRTHLDGLGLAGLGTSGLSRLGFKLGFHIAGSRVGWVQLELRDGTEHRLND